MQSLAEALPREMARVRDEVIPVYQTISTGFIAIALMRQSLDAAAKALAEQDVAAMLGCLEDLRGYKL